MAKLYLTIVPSTVEDESIKSVSCKILNEVISKRFTFSGATTDATILTEVSTKLHDMGFIFDTAEIAI